MSERNVFFNVGTHSGWLQGKLPRENWQQWYTNRSTPTLPESTTNETYQKHYEISIIFMSISNSKHAPTLKCPIK